MSELDDKLSAILSNPQMMQQIMTLAQSLNSQTDTAQPQQKPPEPAREPAPELPQVLNPTMLSKISTLMQHGTIDKDQQSLLKALTPYLSRHKLQKLERAMQAAKVAGVASELVGNKLNHPYSRR